MNKFLRGTLRFFFAVPPGTGHTLPEIRNILIVRQHNQLGDLLIGHSLIAALKARYPDSRIIFIAGPQNSKGVQYDPMLAEVFIFEKRKLFSTAYRNELKKILGKEYDLAIAPVTVSMSFTSNLLARLAKARVRVGAASLNGEENECAFFFHYPVVLNWRDNPDRHVSLRILDILAPFQIGASRLMPFLPYSDKDGSAAKKFLNENNATRAHCVIGIHPGAGKPQNRWHPSRFVELITRLSRHTDCFFYLTGSDADKEALEYIQANAPCPVHRFFDNSILEVAALVTSSSLFVTNDTGIMHVAASTETPQISLFSETNPAQWAPIGENKVALRGKSSIDDITVDEVFLFAIKLLPRINA